MIELEELLFNIFEDLRQKRVPLGMSDYIVALEAVKALTDMNNRDAIQELCRLFWAKSLEDQQLFDEIFAMHITKLQALPKQEEPYNPPASDPIPHVPSTPHTPKLNPPVPEKRQQPKSPMITPRMFPQTMDTTHPREFQPKGTITYHLTPRAPMDKRDMASIWRKLRRAQREGHSEELDVQATTDAFAQTGLLFNRCSNIVAATRRS